MDYSEQLPQGFPADLIPDLVVEIRRSYEENHEYHDPSIGHGPTSYGIHVHETVCLRLLDLEELPNVSARRKSGSIEVRYGPFVLRPYKLGESEEDDVWSSFPNNVSSTALTRMANHNNAPRLPGLEWSEPVEFTDFVIGHFGAYDEEHSEGCRAVYLCVPRYLDGKFGGWTHCIKVYDASEEEDNFDLPASDLPPIEIVDEPEVEFADEAEIEITEEPEIEPVDSDEASGSSSKEDG
jgi:hypothetical protein